MADESLNVKEPAKLIVCEHDLNIATHFFVSVTQRHWSRTSQPLIMKHTITQYFFLNLTQMGIKHRFPPVAGSVLTTTLSGWLTILWLMTP